MREPESLGHQIAGQPANPHHVVHEGKTTHRKTPATETKGSRITAAQHSSVNPVAKGLRIGVKGRWHGAQ